MNKNIPKIIKAKIGSKFNQTLQEYFFVVFAGRDKNATSYVSSKSNRRTAEYGYSFRNMRDSATFSLSNPVPTILVELFNAARESLILKTNIEIPNTFDTCLVNLYTAEVNLFPHVDKDPIQAKTENRQFYFGEQIIGVTLIADSKGGLYIQKIEKEEPKTYNSAKAIHLGEEDGTSYLLSNEYRYAPWYHGVSTIQQVRLSVTFRTLYRIENNGNSNATRVLIPLTHYLPIEKN